MLPIPENSRSLIRAARNAEKWAEENTGILAEFLGEAGQPVIAYGVGGLPAALTLYWSETILLGETPLLAQADAATYHILPYRDNIAVTLFTASPRDSSAYRLMETSRLLGHRLLVVSPQPPPQLEALLNPHISIELRGNQPASLAESMLAIKAAYRHAPRDERGRISRLRSEVRDLAGAMEGIAERYWEAARRIAEAGGELTIAYTPMMMGPAYRIAEMLGETGGKPSLLEASSLAAQPALRGAVALLYTSVEEAPAREIRSKALGGGAKLIEIGLNTDPLTAQIYGLMIALLAEPLIYEWKGQQG